MLMTLLTGPMHIYRVFSSCMDTHTICTHRNHSMFGNRQLAVSSRFAEGSRWWHVLLHVLVSKHGEDALYEVVDAGGQETF